MQGRREIARSDSGWRPTLAQPKFPRLSFGSLRDLLPNILWAEYSDEVASMALQHGEVGDDDLLTCYANTPFRRLFEATRELHERFHPFLQALRS